MFVVLRVLHDFSISSFQLISQGRFELNIQLQEKSKQVISACVSIKSLSDKTLLLGNSNEEQ
jgi:hypothetical protein